MVEQDLSDLSEPLCARPITLQFSGHAKPRNRLGSSSHQAADGHVMCFCRNATRRIGNDIHVIAITHRMDSGHREAHLRPECGDYELLPTRFLHRVDNSFVLPGIDKGAINGFLIWEDVLNGLENYAATLLVHCRQDRRNVERFGRLREGSDIVDDHGWFVAVDVCELERLVVNQHKNAVIWSKKCFEAGLRERLHHAFLSMK